MSIPIISALVSAILIILQQFLMIATGIHRARSSIAIGINEDKDLERKVRRHGNLAENAALYIVTLALTELAGAPKGIIVAFGTVFIIARFSHALGFSSLVGSHQAKGNPIFVAMRVLGAFGTFFSGVALGGYLAYMLSGIGG